MQGDWLVRVYRTLLALYPAAYREEYGDELEFTIQAAVEDAMVSGKRALVRLAWRELRDLPLALLCAHLLRWEGHVMRLQAGAYLSDGPIRSYRLALLFVPFFIPLVLAVPVLFAPGAVNAVVHDVLFACLCIALIGIGVLGMVKGFPAWTLPALGVVLFAVWYPLRWVVQGAVLLVLRPDGNYWPEAIPARLAQQAGLDVAFLVLAILVAALLLLMFPSLRRQVRQDWSSLSFLLYGMSIPYLVLNDPYRGLEPFEAGSALLLAAGAALFVLAPRRWQRLLALVAALLLAHLLLSLGIYEIFPAQTFAGPSLSFRLWETLGPVLELPVLLALVGLPALLGRRGAHDSSPGAPEPCG